MEAFQLFQNTYRHAQMQFNPIMTNRRRPQVISVQDQPDIAFKNSVVNFLVALLCHRDNPVSGEFFPLSGSLSKKKEKNVSSYISISARETPGLLWSSKVCNYSWPKLLFISSVGSVSFFNAWSIVVVRCWRGNGISTSDFVNEIISVEEWRFLASWRNSEKCRYKWFVSGKDVTCRF